MKSVDGKLFSIIDWFHPCIYSTMSDRKKQARQLKLKQDNSTTNNGSTSCHHQDALLFTSDDNNNNNTNTSNNSNSNLSAIELTHLGTSLLGDDQVDGVRRRHSPTTSTPLDDASVSLTSQVAAGSVVTDAERERRSPAPLSVIRRDLLGEIENSDNGVVDDASMNESLTGSSRTVAVETPSDRRSSSFGNGNGVRKQRTIPRNVRTMTSTSLQEVTDPVLAQALQASSYVKQGGFITPQVSGLAVHGAFQPFK